MFLRQLKLCNFRNYQKADIEFSPGLNFIYGRNAQGKTNFLEAIYLLCLGRSFRLARNQDLLEYRSDFFTLQGKISKDNKIDKAIALNYVKDGIKEISIDRKRLNRHSAIFGQFPVVVMAPDEFKITSGGPSERRRFIDILLSQVSLSYLSDLQEYNRVLKQRNKILQDIKENKSVSEAALEPWTQKLIKAGSKILVRRISFVEDFSELLNTLYKHVSEKESELRMTLDSTVAYNNEETIEKSFQIELQKAKGKELFLGNTLIGPHRDDLILEIDGLDLRRFGSRGEHKSVVIALKIAEFKYLKQKQDETPIFLLDDCYSELDEFREANVFQTIQGLGQIFLTSPKESILEEQKQFLPEPRTKFFVEDGRIESIAN